MKNEYMELQSRQQMEFNELPLGFAFSDEQFKEMMEGFGLTISDTDKIVRVAGGAFIQKRDLDSYHEITKRFDKELKEAIAADKTGDGFIYQMFLTELENHEYSYTGDAEDALYELGYTIDEIYADDLLRHGFEKAIQRAAMED